ncbi:hypothetical protein ABG768_006539 [Culter alburnus]|uniref:Uncharacterized protein n=1 Tax=Culter alburnus TaxID=194366 RepID=A0AAW1ZPM4_CULAL
MKRVQQDTTPSHADRETQSGQRMLFTGPDGIGDFRPRLDYFPRSIGIGPLSPDATSDLNYLFRPAAHASPSLPKHRCTGEVGWGLQYSTALNRRTVINNKQYEVYYIILYYLQSAVQDGATPSPFACTQAHSAPVSGQTTDLQEAWNHSTHNTYSKDDNKQIPLNTRSGLPNCNNKLKFS